MLILLNFTEWGSMDRRKKTSLRFQKTRKKKKQQFLYTKVGVELVQDQARASLTKCRIRKKEEVKHAWNSFEKFVSYGNKPYCMKKLKQLFQCLTTI